MNGSVTGIYHAEVYAMTMLILKREQIWHTDTAACNADTPTDPHEI